MSRKRKEEPFVQIKINLPATLNARLELLPELHDPVLQKPKYGKRSELLIELITKYLESRENPHGMSSVRPEDGVHRGGA